MASGGVSKIFKKTLKEMEFHFGGGLVRWFPGHMAVATRAIRTRIKRVDFVIEVRDARIPLSSAYQDLQQSLSMKRRVIVLNKKDLVSSHAMNKWLQYFESRKQDCFPVNSHRRGSVRKLLEHVELRLKESSTRHPTLLVMVIGVPNVGKSVLINSIHQIAASRFPVQGKMKRAKVGPLPGVTRDFSGFKIAQQPSIYVLDTPGVLLPSIPDIEAGLKLALTGSVEDKMVGEERIVHYLLAVLNIQKTPLRWKHLKSRIIDTIQRDCQDQKDLQLKKSTLKNIPPVENIKEVATDAQRSLYETFTGFNCDLEDANELDILIERQLEALQEPLRIPVAESYLTRTRTAKKLLILFRAGLLGPFTLDDIPVVSSSVS